MLVDLLAPHAIAEKGTLKDRLRVDWLALGRPPQSIDELLATIPSPLCDAGAFLDRLTGLWRYEYGFPYELGTELLGGVHMWLPVQHLRLALEAAFRWIPSEKRQPYLTRLADKSNHWTTLSEMMPVARLNGVATADFEVAGLGKGHTTVDWVLGLADRRVALDVKSRFSDLLQQAARKDGEGVMPEPDHDPAILFRSLTKKFGTANPDQILQGAWITTHIKQEQEKLRAAFLALPEDSIHFALFGDWEADVYLMVRREHDAVFLLETLGSEHSTRFVYQGQRS